MTKKYELLYVLNGTLTDEELNSQMEKISKIVESAAEIEDVYVWGRRKLAYEINDLREGFYVIIHFNAEADAPKEIERLIRISDDVLRHIIVLAEGNFVPSNKRESRDEEEGEGAAESSESSESGDEAVVSEGLDSENEAAAETSEVEAEAEKAETVSEVASTNAAASEDEERTAE